MIRPLRILALSVSGVVLAAGTFASSPATAASAPQISKKASLQYCISASKPGCKPAAKFSAGRVTMVCWRDGSTVTGAYRSNRWFYVSQGSRTGWTHSSWVTHQAKVPACSGSKFRGISAATWAAETTGQTKATADQAAWMWGPGSDRYWSGGCAGFAAASYHYGAKVDPRVRDNAKPEYQWYANRSKTRSFAKTPQVGSLVFWPNSSSWGHVAVWVGNGSVVTTWGYPGEHFANRRVKPSAIGTPAAWVAPGDV